MARTGAARDKSRRRRSDFWPRRGVVLSRVDHRRGRLEHPEALPTSLGYHPGRSGGAHRRPQGIQPRVVCPRWRTTRRAGSRRCSVPCRSGKHSRKASSPAIRYSRSTSPCRSTTAPPYSCAASFRCSSHCSGTTLACSWPSWCCSGRRSSGACFDDCARVRARALSRRPPSCAGCDRYLLVNPPDRVELYDNRIVVRLKLGSKFLVSAVSICLICFRRSRTLERFVCGVHTTSHDAHT